MQKIINKIVEESLTDAIISKLRQFIDGNITPEKLCDVLNLCPIYHNYKKILHNKLILSQYNPQENTIHIYLGSIKEQFDDNFYSQITKALFHEIFHFLCAFCNATSLPQNIHEINLALHRKHIEYFRNLIKRFGNINLELAATIFAEKLLNEATR